MSFDFLICYSKNDKYLEDSKILLLHHFLAKLGTFFQPYYLLTFFIFIFFVKRLEEAISMKWHFSFITILNYKKER